MFVSGASYWVRPPGYGSQTHRIAQLVAKIQQRQWQQDRASIMAEKDEESLCLEMRQWEIVPETLQEDLLSKLSAPPRSDAPLITPSDLAEADGFVFGFPTRFSMMAAQF
ncbi:hypothetical protein F2Q68_00011327 [Brassica cretica]|uniref:NAD(P)H dehydrogenase (quinone) n=1 Tax=Brassica cretica TaxID=69181 RepID=A0A8S9KTR3_BRACR|nr:hypothetical protein F2Q68_00011327 [Brassica cretica]